MSQDVKKKIGDANKKTRAEKIKNGWVPPPYIMSDEARDRARKRMLGNTLGKNVCHNKGKTLNLSEEQRKNRSRKRVEYLSSNKSVKSNTKPENQFIDFLIQHNIKFEHQYPIHTANGSWLFDFYLPESDLFIEIDGEFWHSTKRSINRDEIKNHIIKQNGHTLARISTLDLDFSIIFLDPVNIWEKNAEIINNRKKQIGLI